MKDTLKLVLVSDDDSCLDNTRSIVLPCIQVRTTNHAKRHVCTNCGVFMTIVYDEDGADAWLDLSN